MEGKDVDTFSDIKMKILMLTTKFPLDHESPYLTNDICSAFLSAGHEVIVVNIDWYEENRGKAFINKDGLMFYNIAKPKFLWLPHYLRNPATWIFSSLIAYLKTRKDLNKISFDRCVLMTPMTIFASFLFLSTNLKNVKWTSMCWDFFPIHQFNLGLVPKKLLKILHLIEEKIYKKCSTIAVLSTDYELFLKQNYQLEQASEVVVTGLWGGDFGVGNVVNTYEPENLNLNSSIVYGGQLIEGRGLENLLLVAEVASKISHELRILVVGGGNMLPKLKSLCEEKRINNVNFLKPLSRYQYARLIQNCLAGLISLDKTAKCPSFPSKIVDYLRAGLPVIAIDDLNLSLASFIRFNNVGYYVSSDDSELLSESIKKIYFDKQFRSQISQNSLECFTKKFNPALPSDLILYGSSKDV